MLMRETFAGALRQNPTLFVCVCEKEKGGWTDVHNVVRVTLEELLDHARAAARVDAALPHLQKRCEGVQPA